MVRRVRLPNLISNALVVYKTTFTHGGNCAGTYFFKLLLCLCLSKAFILLDPLLAPILAHTSSNAESHFHRTLPSAEGSLLHTHNVGPFLGTRYGVDLVIYSSGECHVTNVQLTVDWHSSTGRAASRLWAGMFAWCIAIASAMNALAWYQWDGEFIDSGLVRYGCLTSWLVDRLKAIFYSPPKL
jgi:glycosylphosphatidylinositol deacylase